MTLFISMLGVSVSFRLKVKAGKDMQTVRLWFYISCTLNCRVCSNRLIRSWTMSYCWCENFDICSIVQKCSNDLNNYGISGLRQRWTHGVRRKSNLINVTKKETLGTLRPTVTSIILPTIGTVMFTLDEVKPRVFLHTLMWKLSKVDAEQIHYFSRTSY